MSRKRPNTRRSSSEIKDEKSSKVTSTEVQGKDEKALTTKDAIPSAANDPEWYARDTRLLVDGASIPFNIPFGARLKLFNQNVDTHFPFDLARLDSLYAEPRIPGVCSVVLKPSMGTNTVKSSPANVCANALYTHVRYVNNGRKNYDPADLFMYVATFGDIYSFVVYLTRLYQYAFMYSQRNYYIGASLIQACGVDPEDIKLHLADFRYWINSIINKISSFAVPADIYYFKRRVFLYSNYYMENPVNNMKDQLYQLVPEGFYSFMIDDAEGSPNKGAGKLQYVGLEDWIKNNPYDSDDVHHYGHFTIRDLQRYFEQVLMANITGDEDFGLMSGDILKAYNSNIIMLSQINEEGGILPVYDPYVLSQFKNAMFSDKVYRHKIGATDATFICRGTSGYVYGDISQSTDGLIISAEGANFGGDAGGLSIMAPMNKVVSVENPDPGVGDVIEATRLLPAICNLEISSDDPGTTGDDTYALYSGTEIAVDVLVTVRPYDSVDSDPTMPYARHGSNILFIPSVGATSTGRDCFADFKRISQFKYGPTILGLLYQEVSNQIVINELVPMSNLDNTTLVTNENLLRCHEIALLSLFYVPGVAKMVN